MTRRFEDLVDLEGLDDEARARLQGVHDLLVAAGPPPELTPALSTPQEDNVVPFRRRRALVGAVAIAAALAAAVFAAGFFVGHGARTGMGVVTVVGMQGEQNSLASVAVGHADAHGNWPIVFSVSGLPKVHGEHAYYILMLEQNGKPRYACGSFHVAGGTTTVRFTVPYKISGSSRWVVTSMGPGVHFPGPVVMRTV